MKTNYSIDFLQVAQWQKSAYQNRALVRVLNESAQETLGSTATPLALAFHEASVAAVYQQFGFSVFCPESRRLLAIAQSRHTLIPHTILLEWLDQAAYQQLADFHVLRYLESEPDWLNLNHGFCVSVIKRIIVCRPQEWRQVGLEHFPRELLEVFLSVVDTLMLAMRQNMEINSGYDALQRAQTHSPFLNDLLRGSFDLWGRAIDFVLARIAEEPLVLLAWRLEILTTERQLLNDARLAVTNMAQGEIELESLKVVILIILLSGFHFGQEEPVVSDTPVTLSQLSRSLDTFFSQQSSVSNVVASLMGYKFEARSLTICLEKVLSLGQQLGIFKWSNVGKNQKGVLLSSLALQVSEPYQELIVSAFG